MPDRFLFSKWFPSPFLKTSAVLHLSLLVILLADPGHWLLITGIILANHAVILGASLWPQSLLLGPNLRRLPLSHGIQDKVALTFDDGPDPEVTPEVLSILEKHSISATFFCIGRKAESYPDLVQKMVRMGHRVENHSYRHANAFAFLGPRAMGREIDRAQKILSGISGSTPVFFRPPAGFRNPFLEPVLASRGLHLASWTRRGYDTVSRDTEKILDRLTRNLKGGDIILIHDGSNARDDRGRPVVIDVLPKLLHRLTSLGLKPIPIPRLGG